MTLTQNIDYLPIKVSVTFLTAKTKTAKIEFLYFRPESDKNDSSEDVCPEMKRNLN